MKSMRKTIVLCLVCLVSLFTSVCWAQQENSASKVFIFLRHAEKEQNLSADPQLTVQGQQQAVAIANLLKDQKVTAVYSTPYRRTKNTVEPLAAQKGLTTQFYEPIKAASLLEQLKAAPDSGVVVFVGHSNTIPAMVNALMGQDVVAPIAESDYGSLFIVNVPAVGAPSLVRLRLSGVENIK